MNKMKKELICITCPKGCHLSVDIENKKVSGNICPRGEEYGINEIFDPKRVVTTTIKIENGTQKVLPVKTSTAIKKNLNFEIITILNQITVKAPITVGDKIIEGICGTDVDIIASRSMKME